MREGGRGGREGGGWEGWRGGGGSARLRCILGGFYEGRHFIKSLGTP